MYARCENENTSVHDNSHYSENDFIIHFKLRQSLPCTEQIKIIPLKHTNSKEQLTNMNHTIAFPMLILSYQCN